MPDMPVQTQRVDGVLCAKVRIPVAINEAGEWIAEGIWERNRQNAKEEVEIAAAECGYGNVAVHFVYALVPIPETQVCYGEVEPGAEAGADTSD